MPALARLKNTGSGVNVRAGGGLLVWSQASCRTNYVAFSLCHPPPVGFLSSLLQRTASLRVNAAQSQSTTHLTRAGCHKKTFFFWNSFIASWMGTASPLLNCESLFYGVQTLCTLLADRESQINSQFAHFWNVLLWILILRRIISKQKKSNSTSVALV